MHFSWRYFLIAIAVITALVLWSRAPDYRVLYSNLSDRDGGAIIAALQQANVPYKFADAGVIPGNGPNGGTVPAMVGSPQRCPAPPGFWAATKMPSVHEPTKTRSATSSGWMR